MIKYNDEIELIFIELPKFKKSEEELESVRDKWIYFIKNAGGLEYTPKTLTTEVEIKKAFEIANTAGMSKEELEAQYKRHEFIYLQKNSIDFALKQGIKQGIKQGREEGIKEGIKQGIEQGREEGIKEGKKEVARMLLSLGEDIEKISKVCGLTINEVKKLTSKN